MMYLWTASKETKSKYYENAVILSPLAAYYTPTWIKVRLSDDL